jgi:hypothetical protein
MHGTAEPGLRLEQPHAVAARMQAPGGGQAGDAAADDGDALGIGIMKIGHREEERLLVILSEAKNPVRLCCDIKLDSSLRSE